MIIQIIKNHKQIIKNSRIFNNKKGITWPYLLALIIGALLIVILSVYAAKGNLKMGEFVSRLFGK